MVYHLGHADGRDSKFGAHSMAMTDFHLLHMLASRIEPRRQQRHDNSGRSHKKLSSYHAFIDAVNACASNCGLLSIRELVVVPLAILSRYARMMLQRAVPKFIE